MTLSREERLWIFLEILIDCLVRGVDFFKGIVNRRTNARYDTTADMLGEVRAGSEDGKAIYGLFEGVYNFIHRDE